MMTTRTGRSRRTASIGMVCALVCTLYGCTIQIRVFVANHASEPIELDITFNDPELAVKALGADGGMKVTDGIHEIGDLDDDLPWTTFRGEPVDDARFRVVIPPASTVWLVDVYNTLWRIRRIRHGDCEVLTGLDCSRIEERRALFAVPTTVLHVGER